MVSMKCKMLYEDQFLKLKTAFRVSMAECDRGLQYLKKLAAFQLLRDEKKMQKMGKKKKIFPPFFLSFFLSLILFSFEFYYFLFWMPVEGR